MAKILLYSLKNPRVFFVREAKSKFNTIIQKKKYSYIFEPFQFENFEKKFCL